MDPASRASTARGESLALHRDGRGALPARRDDQEYREYLVRHEGAEDHEELERLSVNPRSSPTNGGRARWRLDQRRDTLRTWSGTLDGGEAVMMYYPAQDRRS